MLLALLTAVGVLPSPNQRPAPPVPIHGIYVNAWAFGTRRFQDLVVDAYGDPGEDYPLSMAYRHDRMPRISVDTVEEKVRKALGARSGTPAPPGP